MICEKLSSGPLLPYCEPYFIVISSTRADADADDVYHNDANADDDDHDDADADDDNHDAVVDGTVDDL